MNRGMLNARAASLCADMRVALDAGDLQRMTAIRTELELVMIQLEDSEDGFDNLIRDYYRNRSDFYGRPRTELKGRLR